MTESPLLIFSYFCKIKFLPHPAGIVRQIFTEVCTIKSSTKKMEEYNQTQQPTDEMSLRLQQEQAGMYNPPQQGTHVAPNGVAALVLGVLSIITGCYCIGLILGIIGLVLASKGMDLFHSNPAAYRAFGLLRAGKICSIIGVILGALSIVFWFFYIYMLIDSSHSYISYPY
jgi:hypothetical protein